MLKIARFSHLSIFGIYTHTIFICTFLSRVYMPEIREASDETSGGRAKEAEFRGVC